MYIASNGQSFMEFNMQLSAVSIRSGSSDKSLNLGTWKAGFNNNISLIDSESMRNYTADIVYRVATVIVRIVKYLVVEITFNLHILATSFYSG